MGFRDFGDFAISILGISGLEISGFLRIRFLYFAISGFRDPHIQRFLDFVPGVLDFRILRFLVFYISSFRDLHIPRFMSPVSHVPMFLDFRDVWISLLPDCDISGACVSRFRCFAISGFLEFGF